MFMIIGEETRMEEITDVLEKGGTITVDLRDPEIEDATHFCIDLGRKLEEKYGNRLYWDDDYAFQAWSLRTA